MFLEWHWAATLAMKPTALRDCVVMASAMRQSPVKQVQMNDPPHQARLGLFCDFSSRQQPGYL
jgi:hypothetical protein